MLRCMMLCKLLLLLIDYVNDADADDDDDDANVDYADDVSTNLSLLNVQGIIQMLLV